MIVRGLRRIDPDASFLDLETYHEMQREGSGDLSSIGVNLTFRGDSLTVLAPIEVGPAYGAGVQPGDRVEKIDGLAMKGMSMPKVITLLRGRSGTKATMTVARDGWPDSREIQIVREQLPVASPVGRSLGGSVAYIKLLQFREQTASNLDQVLEPLT